jgi:hypothetical protein
MSPLANTATGRRTMARKRSPVEKSPALHREESTTPDLVELARRLVDVMNRRGVAAMMSLFAPDAAGDALGPGDERLQGTTAIRAMLETGSAFTWNTR